MKVKCCSVNYWYILSPFKKDGCLYDGYLHRDLIIRNSTVNEKGEWSGKFNTRKEAEEVLNLYLSKEHNKKLGDNQCLF